MAASKTENILTAFAERLRTVPKAKVERNTAEIERIPEGGLIVVRDGDPGEPERALGGLAFGMTYARPTIDTEAAAGAPAIKTGTIEAVVEYEAATPLG